MITDGLAFTLAYIPAKVVAIEATRALLDRLAGDVAVSSDDELKHAVEFAQKTTQIDRGIAVTKVRETIARAAAAGLNLPAPPENAGQWTAWRTAVAQAISANVEAGGRLGLELGSRAFDLMFAWSRAERIAYLRGPRSDHHLLVAEATQRLSEVASAWPALELAIRSSGRPLLEQRRELIAKRMTHAPTADAVKSSKYGSAFSEMMHWNRGLDGLCENFERDLNVPIDAPPSGPASAEEEQLAAAIVAKPDDDAIRHRFAELAAMRGDPRAKLVREQLTEMSDPDSLQVRQARQLIWAHPEWSAPLTALGARDVKFTRGFPSEITIDLDPLLANAKDLFSLAPITGLRVRGGIAGRGAELAALPQLAQLTLLEVRDQGVTDSDLQALVAKRLPRLRVLNLHMNKITAVGVEALAVATSEMPALTSVNLELNHVNPVDQQRFYNETDQEYVATPEGKALEAKYGRLQWLHPGD